MIRSDSRFLLKAVLAASAAALVLGVALFGCLGENGGILLGFGGSGIDAAGSGSSKGGAGGGGDNPPINGAGTSVVGDWRLYSSDDNGEIRYVSDNPDERVLISFKPSGDFAVAEFYKVGNIWIEYPAVEAGMWRVSGSTVYIRIPNSEGSYEESNGQYTVSGDRLVLTRCNDNDSINNRPARRRCYESTFIKVADAAAFRSGLGGTIYPYNPALRGEWVLQGGNSECDDPWCRERIYFGSISFSGSGANRYIGSDNYSGKYYYTSGGNLHLVVENCYLDNQDIRRCTIERHVVLPYTVTGSGDDRTLTIRTESWIVYQGDNGRAKSRRSLKRQNLLNLFKTEPSAP